MRRGSRIRLGVEVCALIVVGGCIVRPTVSSSPTTKTVVLLPLTEKKITKIDLLFAIDNSASMGDKQALLKDAVPDLIRRLLTPMCIDPDHPEVVFGPSDRGSCSRGELEFSPIADLHVGIVSSSLGGVGSRSCAAPAPPDLNDRAHLVARAELSSTRDGPTSGFLASRPDDARDPSAFIAEFQSLVVGVGQTGCGFEAQEESWYRFLVQPDPYDAIDTSSSYAKLVGVDEEILRQRREFLRPESLVAIIQITDENESTVDPRSLGGRGYELEDPAPGSAPRATAACADHPNDPSCSSCGIVGNDPLPECATKNVSPQDDVPHLRFFHMKQRFGVDPMFPPARYTRGLGFDAAGHTTLIVPNRDDEHPQPFAPYSGNSTCLNPLFAKTLPGSAKEELCKLERGPRGPNLVFYAAITGVPQDLLPATDWTRVIGKDPLSYDFSGADPRMLESIVPRAGVPTDRDTRGVDLQYACTFELAQPRTCDASDPGCDCTGAPGPLCDPSNPHVQVRAKAYPGIRHVALAKSLGKNGIVASICPEDTRDASPANARYGYRPAVRSIADQLGKLIGVQCLPRSLEPDETGRAPCLVLEVMTGETGSDDACDRPDHGLKRADPNVLRAFRSAQAAEHNDLSHAPICEKVQLTPPAGTRCTDDSRAGFCYTRGQEALRATRQQCPEAIVFSKSGQPAPGHTTYMQCIEATD